MKFWDTSALVPLLIAESSTQPLQALAANDPVMVVWWGSEVECVSALARLERDGLLASKAMTSGLDRLRQLAAYWNEVDASDAVREAATRLLRVHPLRAADALQLAAAYLAAERRPSSLELITLDDRLAAAARKEGFMVIDMAA